MIDNPRLDLLIARRATTVIVALAVVGVLALAASGWAVANPHEETTTQEIDHETIETELHTSAIVVEDGLWEEGTELRNSPVYVHNATPTLTLEPRTSVPTDETAVTHDVELRYEATRDGEPFWNRTEPIVREEATIEDGVAVGEADLDVGEVLAERRALEDDLAGVGDIDVTVEVTAAYDTGANAGELRAGTDLQSTEDAYWLGERTPSAEERHAETSQVTETQPRSSLLVGLLALLGASSLGAAWTVSRWSAVDETTARRAVHERRYAEWISRGSIPMWVGEHHISLDTLEDVVDVAIDTNQRVVHDRQRGLFAVLDDDVVYYYTDRGLWEETAWPNMDLEEADADEFEPAGAPGDGPPPAGPNERSPPSDGPSSAGPNERSPPSDGPPPAGPNERSSPSDGPRDGSGPNERSPPSDGPGDGSGPSVRADGPVDASDIDPEDEDAWRQL
ncbi:DUF5305 family protein [Halovivax sp.]|uniref:DUF5305 domain-containing protein n=1 Tax=Halovivax sp. TaxID=1935978 RepID=UPI0025BB45C7|nr:DUF5305 family protein [Halovivax sp.]